MVKADKTVVALDLDSEVEAKVVTTSKTTSEVKETLEEVTSTLVVEARTGNTTTEARTTSTKVATSKTMVVE